MRREYLIVNYECEDNWCFNFQEAREKARIEYLKSRGRAKYWEVKFHNPGDYNESWVANILEVQEYEEDNALLILDRTIERTTERGRVIAVFGNSALFAEALFKLRDAAEKAFDGEFDVSVENYYNYRFVWREEHIAFATKPYRMKWDGERKHTVLSVDSLKFPISYIEDRGEIKVLIHAGFVMDTIERVLRNYKKVGEIIITKERKEKINYLSIDS